MTKSYSVSVACTALYKLPHSNLDSNNNGGTPLNCKKLLKDIWKYDDQIDTHTLETHIYSLRKKLETKLGLKNFVNHLEEGYQIDKSLL